MAKVEHIRIRSSGIYLTKQVPEKKKCKACDEFTYLGSTNMCDDCELAVRLCPCGKYKKWNGEQVCRKCSKELSNN